MFQCLVSRSVQVSKQANRPEAATQSTLGPMDYSLWPVKNGFHAADPTLGVIAFGRTENEAKASLAEARERAKRADALVQDAKAREGRA